MIRDLASAWRALIHRPALLAAAVVSLAIGIGVNVAVFSVINGALLEPFPYRDPERLAVIWHSFGQGQSLPALHPQDVRDYKARATLFEDFTLVGGFETILESNDDAELVRVGSVAANFFPFLGIEPALGRHFTPEEDLPGGPRAIWISDEIWERRFGRDPAIIGRSIGLDGIPHQIVGVLKPGFELYFPREAFFIRRPQIYRPTRLDYGRLAPRNFTAFAGIGRLKPGVTIEQARNEMEGIGAELKREVPEFASGDLRVGLIPFNRDVLKGVRRGLFSLMGAVGFVLLIACANVARLLLARGFSRETEFRMRAALGAGRAQLARTVLAEGALISFLGALCGVLLAALSLQIIRTLEAAAIPRLETVALDWRVLGFAVIAAVGSSILVAFIPAIRAAAAVASPGMSPDARSTGSARKLALQDRLVVAQIALAVIVVVGTGFMIQSFRATNDADLGFAPRGLATVRIALPRTSYGDPAAARQFFRELETRVLALPGVLSVAGTSLMPLNGAGPLQPYAYDAETARAWESATADRRRVSAGFVRTIGATLVAGREFEEADEEPQAPRRIIIDTALAARAFPGRNAVSQRLQLDPDPSEPNAFAEIIGVVAPLSLQAMVGVTMPQIYEPGVLTSTRVSLIVRTSGDEASLGESIRGEVLKLSRGAAVQDVRTMTAVVDSALGPARLATGLMSLFGIISLVLSALGIYSALAYSVNQRVREIGIRMALGEAPSSLRARFLTQGLRLVGISLAIGTIVTMAALASARVTLYGVRWNDPSAYAGAAAAIAFAAFFACWIPARRAAAIDPLGALRHE